MDNGQALLLFDFDGVLADSLSFYAEAVRIILERIGTPIVQSRDDYLELFDGNFYASMESRGVDLSAFSKAAKEILPTMDYSTMKPFPGFAPVLAALKSDCLLAVVSSNSAPVIEKALDRFGHLRYFQDILGSDFLFSKQEKIVHALSKYGFDPAHTYYIGDTTGDIVEAKAAGVLSVAATWGWHSRRKLAGLSPDYIVDRPEELLKLTGQTGAVEMMPEENAVNFMDGGL